jgi:hypothetical protein
MELSVKRRIDACIRIFVGRSPSRRPSVALVFSSYRVFYPAREIETSLHADKCRGILKKLKRAIIFQDISGGPRCP